MTDEAKKIDKKVIECVLNEIKEHCENRSCAQCEFYDEFGLCALEQPLYQWDTKKIAEVIVDDL